MDPREALKRRLEARKAVQDFFKEKRKKLKVGPFWDFSAENRIKRRFLGMMNSIAKDLELKAMKMAENGENWEEVLEEAQKRLEKLKEDFLKEIEENEIWGKTFSELAELIKSL